MNSENSSISYDDVYSLNKNYVGFYYARSLDREQPH